MDPILPILSVLICFREAPLSLSRAQGRQGLGFGREGLRRRRDVQGSRLLAWIFKLVKTSIVCACVCIFYLYIHI